MSAGSSLDLKKLLGIHPSSEQLSSYLLTLSGISNGSTVTSTVTAEIKSYPDAVYFNYYSLGLSLLFKPVNGYKPTTGLKREDLQDANLELDGIDIFNAREPKSPYTSYPVDTLTLGLVPIADKERPEAMIVKRDTTGKEFVSSMGEPARKGAGGASIGVWCEWTGDGVLVELGGKDSKGPKAWETAKDAIWEVISIFPGKSP